MKLNHDLRLQIILTPSQLEFIPQIIEKINAEPEMLMGRILLEGNLLKIECHDIAELIEKISPEKQIEKIRLKKQILVSLNEALASPTVGEHQKKNFSITMRKLESL